MYSRSTASDALIAAINEMPAEWALTPCVEKKNLWPGWQRERLDRAVLVDAIRRQVNSGGKPCAWTGVSIVTGPLSQGLMAVDFDGPLALQKYFEFSDGQPPATTKRWTSGRPGHFQILLSVPEAKWEGLKPIKIELENNEKLEFRWNQCSTLPPSIHPDTGEPYFWKNQGEIAECPDWILDLMREVPAVELPQKPSVQNTIYIDVEKSLVDILENEILPRLDAEEFYGNWASLKTSGKNLKGLCPLHQEKTPSFSVTPSEKTFHCFGCGAGGGPVQFLHQIKGGSGSPTGKEFTEVVQELAGRVGVQMPERQPQNLKFNNQNSKPNNLLKHPANYAPEPAPAEEILSSVDDLLAEELTPAKQIVSSLTAAKRAGVPEKVLRELLVERQAEQDLDWSLIESRENFQRLYQIEKTQINLYEIFPPALAKALLSKAESDRVDPVRILQSLLPVVGTVLGGRVGIELKKGYSVKDSHIEYPIFFTADIGHPSTGKSATQGTLVEPLQEMQDDEQERLDVALMELDQLADTWKTMGKDEKAEKADSDENPRNFEEKYCKPKKWLLDEASAQALTKRISEQAQNHGCLLLQDELVGLFDSMDQFTGGKGGQRQFLLKAWNKPLRGSVDRVDLNASYFFKSQTLSLTGTIQPTVARRIFNTAADPDGMLSRFLPAIASIPDNFVQRPTVRVNVYSAIKHLIKGLQQLPETLLTLPPATAEIFWSHWENLRRGQNANFDSNPAYSYFLGKQISYVGRFAIVIHCLENLGASTLPPEVSAEVMRKAVRLSLFYCGQFLLLQAKSARQQPIEGVLLEILQFIKQRGGRLSTRELYHSRFKRVEIEGKKINAHLADKILTTIADAGYGIFSQKVFTLLEPTGDTGGDKFKCFDSKALRPSWRQNPEVCVSPEIPKSGVSLNSKGFIDELDYQNEENPEILENINFANLSPQTPQTFSLQVIPLSPPLVPSGSNGDSETLNEDETELLEMLQKSVIEKDAIFARDVRGILKEVCDAGAADRKKVWGSLGDVEQRIFTELLAVEISPEVGHVIEAMQQILPTDDPNEIDHLYQVFTPELIDRAVEFLGAEDKSKFLQWAAILKLAEKLVNAIADGPGAVVEAATDSDLVELAIGRLEFLKEWDALDEIRDALG